MIKYNVRIQVNCMQIIVIIYNLKIQIFTLERSYNRYPVVLVTFHFSIVTMRCHDGGNY